MTYDAHQFTPDDGRQTTHEVSAVPVKPCHLSDAQLLTQYELLARAGSVACAVRAASLRRRIQDS